jgi:Tfp pilus assembly protein PilF
MFRRAFVFSILLALTSSTAIGQRPPGGSGNSGGRPGNGGNSRPSMGPGNNNTSLGLPRTVELRVHLAWPNDRPVGENISVQLVSNSGGVAAQTFSNSQGDATFAAVNPGSYTLRISGPSVVDTTSENIYIDRNQSLATQWVHVQPREEAKTETSKEPMVSAADLNAPDKAKKEFGKGNEAFVANDFKKAQSHYQKAVEIYPRYATAYNNLGAVYMHLQDPAHAREAFEKAVEISPLSASSNANLARLNIQDKKFADAVPLLERALTSAPKDPEFMMLMAHVQLETGHVDQALSFAHKVNAAENPKFAAAHLIAARAYEVENKPEDARTEYELFLKQAPDAPQIPYVRQALSRLNASVQRNRVP